MIPPVPGPGPVIPPVPGPGPVIPPVPGPGPVIPPLPGPGGRADPVVIQPVTDLPKGFDHIRRNNNVRIRLRRDEGKDIINLRWL